MTEHDGIVEHYERLLAAHGATPRGADFRDEGSQRVRFERLDRLVLDVGSVCDLGCGYGAYLDHLRAAGWRGTYVGVDLTEGMVAAARAAHPGERFEVGTTPVPTEAVVASGTFNVRFGDDDAWTAVVREAIGAMWAAASVGIALNLLSRAVSPHLFSISAAEIARWLPPGSVIEEDVGAGELTVLARR